MKREILSGSLIALLLLICPAIVRAQTSTVPWSCFNTGSALSTAGNTLVVSAVGQVFAGETGIDDVLAESGFLAILLSRGSMMEVDEGSGLPLEYALRQNYPNPFNPSTTLEFALPEAVDFRLVVYDLLGREVVRLVQQRLEAGWHQLIWNGRDARGRDLPSGVYIALMTTPGYSQSIKMLLLK
ncbi:MAG: T9SS type A sorting domain-containing protein [Fidelibacterota bacterium]|nr:MAG: T9SS type A sorting domain-containing protein [Candidatus Neomarinimicrobiota bacterium]